jgi:hypothetical protein
VAVAVGIAELRLNDIEHAGIRAANNNPSAETFNDICEPVSTSALLRC